MDVLSGTRVVSIGINLPAPAAAARLTQLGAAVTKVEPPTGDPLQVHAPRWYDELTAGQVVLRLDLKLPDDRARLDELLGEADVFLTSHRPSALRRLQLAPGELQERFPRLLHVAIVGHAAPDEEVPGHDLTYQAALGLAAPPALPRTLLADLGGADRAVGAALALLLGRERGLPERYAQVALAEAAAWFADALRHGITAPGGLLGGGFPAYGLYEASDGWVAVAALEPHFQARLLAELGVECDAGALAVAFRARTAGGWEAWAAERDLPLVAVRQ